MFDNKYFIGVTTDGYFVTKPIAGPVQDDNMLEVAALIVAMKPRLRQRFEEILQRIESGE
jgi:hypothetical protein